jgi:hypothetical protein
MAKILLLNSWITLLSSCWLAVMELILRHPGYWARFGVAVSIMVIGLSTILVRVLHLGIRIERWLWVGAVVLLSIGGKSFIHNVHAVHFEGFVSVISLILVLQGVMMLAFMGRSSELNHRLPLAPT